MVVSNDNPDLGRFGIGHTLCVRCTKSNWGGSARRCNVESCCKPVTKVRRTRDDADFPCYSPLRAPIYAAAGAILTIDEELNQLEDGVRRLKIEYDIFFGGGAKKPPTDLEWRVQSLLKKYSDGRRLTYGQRFKFSSVQQKFAVYNSLWQQKLRIKEEGYRRPQDALLAIQGVRQIEDEAPEVIDLSKPEPFRIICSDVDVDVNKVRALYDAMAAARKEHKAKGPAGNFESFQQFVKKKTEQLRKEYDSSTVEYAIEVEDGQVRLKAKASSKTK